MKPGGLLLALSLLALPAAAFASTAEERPVRLEPQAAEIFFDGAGDIQTLRALVRLLGGAVRDASAAIRWKSEHAAICAVRGQRATALKGGSTWLSGSYRGLNCRVRVRVPGGSRERPASFRYDLSPALTLGGCNQGACHGNAEGRGGLKLSLLGEDPEHDYRVLVRDGSGRRLNRSAPERSLLLLKGLGAVAHGGGVRWRAAGSEFQAVRRWLAAGAPGPEPAERRLVHLQVSPDGRVQKSAAKLQPLNIVAHFSDGSKRTATDLARLSTGEPDLELMPGALAAARGPVDAAVLVSYAGAMRTVRLTWIEGSPGFRWSAPAGTGFIDRLNYRRLRELQLRPSQLAGDSEFIRRIYLDLLGALPEPHETEAFLADSRPDKRARLIDQLLTRPEHVDFFAQKLSDVLRLEERSLDPKGARVYWEMIRAAIAEDRPWDQWVRELLTASGSTYVNPAANYYRRTRTPESLAETTAQLFLGARLLCARCHNHPFERWSHQDFYSLAAYFARVGRTMPQVNRKDRFDLHERIGEEFIQPIASGEVIFPKTGAALQPAAPAWLPAAEAGRPSAGETDRRRALAAWITDPRNPLFARAAVNRFWFYLFGKGLVDPVDDLRESNPASNPELLDALADFFVRNGYSVRRLLREMLNSSTYQLSSAPNATNAADERFFSRALVRRLPAEVLLDAVSRVTGVPETFPNAPVGTTAVQAALLRSRVPFLTLFGQPPREDVCECERGDQTTLRQSFALIGGAEINDRLKSDSGALARMLRDGALPEQIIRQFYLAALCRPPSSLELAAAGKYLQERSGSREAYEDLVWALLNSQEFLLRR